VNTQVFVSFWWRERFSNLPSVPDGANPNALDPDLRAAMNDLQQWLGSQRIILTITSTVRSGRDQDFLWKRFRAGTRRIARRAAWALSHEYGWAFDAVVSPVEYQVAVGRAWEKEWGGKWGGSKTLSTLNSQEPRN